MPSDETDGFNLCTVRLQPLQASNYEPVAYVRSVNTAGAAVNSHF